MGQIVGGYAAFGGLTDARPVVEALAASPLVDGLETPFRGGVIEVPAGAPDTWRYVVTLIPETMQRVGADAIAGAVEAELRARLRAAGRDQASVRVSGRIDEQAVPAGALTTEVGEIAGRWPRARATTGMWPRPQAQAKQKTPPSPRALSHWPAPRHTAQSPSHRRVRV